LGSRDTIRLDAIAKLEFVREEATNGHTECSLLRTFRKHLPGFDAAAAKKGLKARRGGRWLCFPGGHSPRP